MDIPPGFETDHMRGRVCRLRKSLYGLKQSPRAWFDKFTRVLKQDGYLQSQADHTLFFKHFTNGKITVLIVYVDDIVLTGNYEEEIRRLKLLLSKEFEIKDLGHLRYFLGMEVARSRTGISVSQRKYVLDLLKETGMIGCRLVDTPMDPNTKLMPRTEEMAVDKGQYQRLVGKLIYLTHMCLDISFAVSRVSQFLSNPSVTHMEAVDRILRYLKRDPGKGLMFKKTLNRSLEVYTDADWAGSPIDRKSTSGYCSYVWGNLVTWRSKKQQVVARSSAEAEFRALAQGICEGIWLKRLLDELKVGISGPIDMMCDNQSAIAIAKNPIHHDRTKHVEIDRHFISEKIESNAISLKHVPSRHQAADILTKALFRPNFVELNLLDYINPSHDAKGRDASKRKSNMTKLKGKSYQTISVASSDESPKETSKETSDEETPILEPQGSTGVIQEPTAVPVEPHLTVLEESSVERPNSSGEVSSEGEEGWQPVQRPRSANSYGRRLKQRRATIGKVYTYQKKHMDTDVEYPSVKNNLQSSSRYYVVKKRTISHGSHMDQQNTNTSQVTKFGRRIVKTVTYRVKSMPSSTKTATPETSRNGGLVFVSPVESGQSSLNDINSMKNPIVSLGKSPSYKEVALAPPGTIAKMQVEMPQSDIRDNTEHDVGKHEEETNEAKGNADSIVSGVENILLDKNENSTDLLKEETKVIKEEETHSTDATEEKPSVIVFGSMDGLGSSGVEVSRVIEDNSLIDGLQDSFAPSKEEGLSEKNSSSSFELHVSPSPNLLEADGLKDKSLNSGDSRALTNKKLSASAAPFNPSPAIARPTPVTMNITLSVGPGGVPAIAPWPVNMNLHPGPGAVLPTVNPMCSSPHHPYPSPPPTPNMIQPLPFMYPPYTQPQPVPSSTFPVTSSAFHPNRFPWQCNMNLSVPEFAAGPVWTACHPVEFSVPAPVAEPIADPVMEQIPQHDDSAPILPVDIETVTEVKKEANLQASEAIGHANPVAGVGLENIKENGPSNLGGAENAGNEPSNRRSGKAGRSDEKMDGERTFSILIRGRRNRKQTLRMPISLLSRPYGSQSFKVIYNRVVRGSDVPKTTSFSSTEDCTASAT
ncbi:hypothetical protein L484_017568 [Morus notabilis]|uniref:Reverse transcriptase Ty1/copia-type domain-containing protein n=1 Tax=Morus notabilis TaxID=981085 RepID=W9RAE4_9ROSA|nr:hypothetical protein L484_017568 [Morus notabilis]